MAGITKKILTAAGVAAATAGLAVAATRRKGEAAATVYHVRPTDGGWVVEAEGAERASSRHRTKREAVDAGREIARSRGTARLVIHGADGGVQRSHDYTPSA